MDSTCLGGVAVSSGPRPFHGFPDRATIAPQNRRGLPYPRPVSALTHLCTTPPPPQSLLHDVATGLRLLNAVREPVVGLPLTWGQLQALGPRAVVARWGLGRLEGRGGGGRLSGDRTRQ